MADQDAAQVLVLTGSSEDICTTFHIRRAATAAEVASAPVEIVATTGPVEDEVLSDGENHFYLVEHAGGLPLILSVNAVPSADSVRLGFDDGDPLSAPVDAVLSSQPGAVSLAVTAEGIPIHVAPTIQFVLP